MKLSEVSFLKYEVEEFREMILTVNTFWQGKHTQLALEYH